MKNLMTIDFKQLASYLEIVVQRYGYIFDREKSCQKFKKYSHPCGDKILLLDKRNDNNYHYFRNCDNNLDYGDVTTFILHRLNGASNLNVNATLKTDRLRLIKELDSLNLLNGVSQIMENKNEVKPKLKESFDISKYKINNISEIDDRAYNILARRGINIDIKQEEFKNSFKIILSPQREYPNLLFTWTDENDIIVGGQYKYYDGDKCIKKFLANTDREKSLWKTDYQGKNAIFITEDPIDALSHKQMYPNKNYCYVCTGGNIAHLQFDILLNLSNSTQLPIVLGMDNDEKGREMNIKIIDHFAKKQNVTILDKMEMVKYANENNIRIEIPTDKDWNEQLKNMELITQKNSL